MQEKKIEGIDRQCAQRALDALLQTLRSHGRTIVRPADLAGNHARTGDRRPHRRHVLDHRLCGNSILGRDREVLSASVQKFAELGFCKAVAIGARGVEMAKPQIGGKCQQALAFIARRHVMEA